MRHINRHLNRLLIVIPCLMILVTASTGAMLLGQLLS